MIGDALQIITKAIDLVSKLRDMKVKDAEAQHSIADLNLALAEIKTKYLEARDRIAHLESELNEARKMPDLRDKLHINMVFTTSPNLYRDAMKVLTARPASTRKGSSSRSPSCQSFFETSNASIATTARVRFSA